MADNLSDEEILIAAVTVKMQLMRRYFWIHVFLGICVLVAAIVFLLPVWLTSANDDEVLPLMAAKAGAGIIQSAAIVYLWKQAWALHRVIDDGHRFVELVTDGYRSRTDDLRLVIRDLVMDWIGR